jgi:cytochrome oxidase Cu insertion factor (SCO1/SenC/PrrC family)
MSDLPFVAGHSAYPAARLGMMFLFCSLLACGGKPGAPAAKKKAGAGGATSSSAETGTGANAPAPALGAAPKPPPVLFPVSDFSLTDQDGEVFHVANLRGRVWIANFMFTRCTATCPAQAAKLVEIDARSHRWPDWARIHLVSITVDPEYDTSERMKEYADSLKADHAQWKFLSGPRSEVFRISKDVFKLPVAEASETAATPITHSSRFALVDGESQIRGFYDALDPAEFAKLMHDLRVVLMEAPTSTVGPTHIGLPLDVFDPPWLAARQEAQRQASDKIGVFHDFEFTDRAAESGIRFVNRTVPDVGRNFKLNHYDHGNGLAVADVDGDGLYDIYFVNQLGGNELWRNLGQGHFENFTEQAGVGLKGRLGVSASFADTDNDGDPDLFVTTTRHGNAFFENEGKGRFRDVTAKSGLNYKGHSSSAEFFDYDGDGLLDLFVTNVGVFTTDTIGHSENPELSQYPYFTARKNSFVGHLFPELTERSILYRNEGNNRFRDVSQDVGLIHDGWSGDATPLDANNDGWIDLYVVNMQGNDEYYENQGGKKFERRSDEVFPATPWGAMGVKAFDYNNDGRLDLFVTNMHADMFELLGSGPGEKRKAAVAARPPESMLRNRNPSDAIYGNAFYENQGRGRFVEISDRINAENYWPWGPSVGDLNADGYLDVFVPSSMNLTYRYHVNSLLLNDGGKTFRDAEFILGVEPRVDSKTAVPWFELDCSGADADHDLCQGRAGRVVVWGAVGSRSAAIFDLDQDGDLDIVTNDSNSGPMVLVSNLSERRPDFHYLQVHLRGTRANHDGLGARVEVTVGGRTLTQVHDGQSGYLSQSSLPLYFGLGAARTVDQIVVQWPGGKKQTVAGPIATNRLLAIIEESVE